MTFKIDRFVNFGKYDLTINKIFYRNMALLTIAGTTGITIIAFLVRWAEYRRQLNNLNPDFIEVEDLSMANTIVGCSIYFITLMMIIFSGHAFHNLRNKQGRISELTIPVTNIERWTWHILMVFIAGSLSCCFSVIFADAVNALLNLLTFGTSYQHSLTLDFIKFYVDYNNDFASINWGNGKLLLPLIYSFIFFTESIYILGNAIKYRFNIIWTYIVTQLIGIFTIISFTIIGINFGDSIIDWLNNSYFRDWITSFEKTNVETFITCFFITIFTLLSVVFLRISYKLYCKAQITSKLSR